MAALETRLQILAEDATAGAFASVAARIEGLQAKVAEIGATAGATVQRANVASAAAEPAKTSEGGGFIASLGEFAVYVTGAKIALDGYTQSVDQAHERERMRAQDMSPQEIAHGEHLAADLAKKYPVVTPSDMLNMLRNATPITGTFDDAAKVIEPLAKLRVVAQAANANAAPEEINQEFDQLLKGIEIKGATQNPAKFQEYMEGIAKGLNSFGDTLKPYQYYEMFKYGRQATQSLSEHFILSTAPSLAQELGGSSYGRAVSAFNRAIVGGHMDHAEYKQLEALGLLSPEDVLATKTGEIKGIAPGHSIHGADLAQTDPNAWVRTYLLPALQAAGKTTPEEISKAVSALFSNQMASQMVSILAGQTARIDKDARIVANAHGLSSAADFLTNDPKIAALAAKNAAVSSVASDLDPKEINKVLQFGQYLASLKIKGVERGQDSQGLSGAVNPEFWRDWAHFNDIVSGVAAGSRARNALYNSGYRPSQGGGWFGYGGPSDLSLEQGREASRGRALSGMTPLDVTGKVTLDPSSKASVSVDVRVEAGDGLLKFVTNAIASSSGNIAASLGRMDGDAAPRRAAGFGAH